MTGTPGWAPDFLFSTDAIAWVQSLFGRGHPLPFQAADLLSGTWGVLFAVSLALWLWGRADAYAVAAIVTLESLTNLLLNRLLSVPRPSGGGIVIYEHVALDSFPSGHVFTATVLWGLLWARGRIPLWSAALVVLAVGVARLYLGVHYLGDVVAGALFGTVLVWFFHRAWPAIEWRLMLLPFRFFLWAGLVLAAASPAAAVLVGGENRFFWNALGLISGGGVALLLEHRFVRHRPAAADPPRAGGVLLLGLLGMLVFLIPERLAGDGALVLGAILSGLGALWALAVTPALWRWWARRGREPGTESAPARPFAVPADPGAGVSRRTAR